ncbi:MAG: type II toxin-antitoxin system RelB/DinJ family antitoxin [Campylobacter sp.]|nr:type II toxin-antitoxin system RelB/DinJ family antitoxin [Campylobacter sp.]MBQ7675980.1 type II toxin-antitoxin system RelB/DinJ family antitoxin [Campylobacter sp.]MBQ9876005.1 type II toxin-antitoxin system RelB/DinJ family antitoxin [Campylobacter sp.]
MTTTIQVRINKTDKSQLENILRAMGLDVSSAFRLFATQVIRQKKLPFEVIANDDLLDESNLSDEDTKKLLELVEKDNRGELKFVSLDEMKQRTTQHLRKLGAKI